MKGALFGKMCYPIKRERENEVAAMLTILLAMLEDEEDQRKFLKLHTAYEQKLYRIALKILRSHELAKDAVQQS